MLHGGVSASRRGQSVNALSIQVSSAGVYAVFLPSSQFRPHAAVEHAVNVVDRAGEAVERPREERRARGDDEALDVVEVGVGDGEASAERQNSSQLPSRHPSDG